MLAGSNSGGFWRGIGTGDLRAPFRPAIPSVYRTWLDLVAPMDRALPGGPRVTRNLPDFLVIGAQKAGTTWLHAMLAQHPDVWMGPYKEYHFFNSLFVPRHRAWTSGHTAKATARAARQLTRSRSRSRRRLADRVSALGEADNLFTEEWYRAIFSLPGAASRAKGDITPAYCALPEAGIRFVHDLLGPVPVIYLIRDPVARGLSQLKMNMHRRGLTPPLDRQAWRRLVWDWDILNRGNYAAHVPRWLEHYPRERILFLPYGLIARDPSALLGQVERHLGLSRHTYQGLGERVFGGRSLELPDFVPRLMAKRMAAQYPFLTCMFGAEFLANSN